MSSIGNYRLFIGPGSDPDAIYALGFKTESPLIILYNTKNKKKIIIISELELNLIKNRLGTEERAGKKGISDSVEIILFSEFRGKSLTEIAVQLLRKKRIRKVVMSEKTPAIIYKRLSDQGINISLRRVFPERRIKSREEIEKIKSVGLGTEKAMRRVITIIKESEVNNRGELVYQGKRVTSELLRYEAHKIFEEEGLLADETIISHGIQSAKPHETGSGVIKEGELIILDFFPKSRTTGYYFDMSRTVVRNPGHDQKRLFNTVLKAQQKGLSMIKEGVRISDINKAVKEFFDSEGYVTNPEKGEGFIHSLGHGVGLEIHEEPSISMRNNDRLKAGDVITIEPGLYYEKIGGVRIEDTVVVTKNGHKNLTRITKKLLF